MTEQSGRVLIISDVQSSNAGVYTCISVQDGFENITTSVTMSVIGMKYNVHQSHHHDVMSS